jgi:hypothetical protein
MTLTMRATGLGHGVYKASIDTAFSQVPGISVASTNVAAFRMRCGFLVAARHCADETT